MAFFRACLILVMHEFCSSIYTKVTRLIPTCMHEAKLNKVIYLIRVESWFPVELIRL